MHVDPRSIKIFKICSLELTIFVIFYTFCPSEGHEITYNSFIRANMHSTPQDLSFEVLHKHVVPIITIFKNHFHEANSAILFLTFPATRGLHEQPLSDF